MKSQHLLVQLGAASLLLSALAACSSSPPASSTQSPPNGNPSVASTSTPPPKAQPTPAKPPPPPPPPLVVPQGTVLTVSLQQPISSKTSHEGDRFQAVLAEPIVVESKIAIPKGADVSGSVTQAHPAGRFKGGATLALTLDSIVVRAQPYAIQTAATDRESKGKGKRTAGMVGGGAAGAAAIGGIAGGGKGAAIGASLGAVAGTAGAALTGNRDITLPAEALVSFTLLSAIEVKQAAHEAAPSP